MNTIVTIIIPTYNYAGYIAQAVGSVYAQDYPLSCIQCVVIDDGSTDNTIDVVAKLQEQYTGLQYFHQSNAGKAAATQFGISVASGKIIFTLDADDWFLPGKITETVSVFQQYPQVQHVASPATIHWQNGQQADKTEPIPLSWLGTTLSGNKLLKHYYTHNQLFGGGSTFAGRSSWLKNIPCSAAIDMYTDEWLVIQALLTGDTYFLPKPYSVWRIHSSNYSGSGGEALAVKQARLFRSSAAVLQMLQPQNYPQWLRNAYQLKHQIRQMVWKEQLGTKTLHDRLQFLKQTLFSSQPFSRLWHYKAFNRIVK